MREGRRASAVRAAARASNAAHTESKEGESEARVLRCGTANESLGSNRVATTKYNLLTFLPRGLYEQFRRVANFYFLVVALLSLTPFSPVRADTTFTPLSIVIGFSLVKEAYEDFKRWAQDLEQNNNRTLMHDRSNTFTEVRWADVRVGSIVKISRDDALPADIICLKTSSAEGLCHVETKNLDGETNLKPKRAIAETNAMPTEQVLAISGEIECELPNERMYTFSGALSLNQQENGPSHFGDAVTDVAEPSVPEAPIDSASESSSTNMLNSQRMRKGNSSGEANDAQAKVSLSADNLLLRGTFLRNTQWIIGVVVYTGHDAKILKNSLRPPSKRSAIERAMDWVVSFMLLWLFTMCIIAGVWFGVNTATTYSDMWYLKPSIPSDAGAFDQEHPARVGVFNFITTFVLLGYFIPISLYVSLEIIKLIQMSFMNLDRMMYHEETDTPFAARTSNLNEELGMVTTVLSDKTGTLTQNKMEFFKASIGGTAYGEGQTEVERTLQKFNGEDDGSGEQTNTKPIEPGNNFRDERINNNAWVNEPNASFIRDFFFALAVCNTAIPEHSFNEWGVQYQCESPDEAAFVVVARRFGIILHSREAGKTIVYEFGERKEYEVLEVLEFSSNRKRQSVILRAPNGKLILLCKGADSVLLERMDESSNSEIRNQTEEHVNYFAAAGLRTLVVGMRELSEEEVNSFRKEFNAAQTAIHDRQTKVEAVEDTIERKLTILGATAIEDKLQLGVPEAVASLASTGIGVWVLTGDKPDTAINIAYACNLIRQDMQQLLISIDKIIDRMRTEGDTRELFQEARASVQQQIDEFKEEVDAMENPQRAALVVDGRALGHAMSEHLAPKLLDLMRKCGSVVCCRVSPLQKALVTNLAKKGGLSTLAIGDGANDVGMIQKANIGVGISGQEGMQAVMASDFALAQFRFLERLLVVHGRWNYRRIARFVTYFFYKNVAFGLALFLFSAFDFFSSQRVFNDWHMAGFNVLFAALPIIVVAIFDQDVSQQVSHENVYLYKVGTQGGSLGQLFTIGARAYWLLNGTYQGIFLFCFVFLGVYRKEATEANGKVPGLLQAGLALYTAIVLTINFQLVQMQMYWNWLMHLAVWVTVLIWFTAITVMSEDLSPEFASDQYKLVFSDVFQSPTFWLTQPVAVGGALLPDLVCRTFQRRFHPRDVDVVQDVYYGAYNCRCLFRRDIEPYGDRKPNAKKRLYSSLDEMLTAMHRMRHNA